MRIIAGQYRGKSLKTTNGSGYRPAMGKVREALFSMLDAKEVLWEKANILDLFAGSGSLGFEALSRGAMHVTFVESAHNVAKVIRSNASLLGVSQQQFSIHQNEVGKVLGRKATFPFSVVFIDPPYKMNVLKRTLDLLIKNQWINSNSIINAEVEAKLPFDPEKVHPSLITLNDRSYGQTRVILWKTTIPSSIQEHLTPLP